MATVLLGDLTFWYHYSIHCLILTRHHLVHECLVWKFHLYVPSMFINLIHTRNCYFLSHFPFGLNIFGPCHPMVFQVQQILILLDVSLVVLSVFLKSFRPTIDSLFIAAGPVMVIYY